MYRMFRFRPIFLFGLLALTLAVFGQSVGSSGYRQSPGVGRREAAGSSHRPDLQTGSPWPKIHSNLVNSGIGVAGGANGVLRWRVPGSNGGSPAIAADGTVYIGSDDDNLYAFNP